MKESSAEKVGPLPEQTIQQQYVMDRSSLENVKSEKAYAYAPQNETDRAPHYSINFPFGTGAGPYTVWKNEIGASYAAVLTYCGSASSSSASSAPAT